MKFHLSKSILFCFMLIIVFEGCQKSQPTFQVKLTAQVPDENTTLRWSPKGEKLVLNEVNSGLQTKLYLGSSKNKPFLLRLEKKQNKKYFSTLIVDTNQDGSFTDEELITITPKSLRGKMWSSFNTVLQIPVVDPYDNKASTNSYPISFWYVEGPNIDKKDQVLRFSRRGWMLGKTNIEDVDLSVLLTESKMDGVFDTSDSWAIATNEEVKNLYSPKFSRQVTQHTWLSEQAFRIKDVHSSGRKIGIEKFDPGITRAEEEKQNDVLAADRNAPHSGNVVAFGHNFKAAEEQSRLKKKDLFIDFETTWCGPCKTMDKLVYTADEVVEASKNVVAVKVDGDEHPELVKRFKVEAYPTILLVSPDKKILNRAVGYQSVKKMSIFLKAAIN